MNVSGTERPVCRELLRQHHARRRVLGLACAVCSVQRRIMSRRIMTVSDKKEKKCLSQSALSSVRRTWKVRAKMHKGEKIVYIFERECGCVC